MQERNFERQVKEALEGLSISPSAPVWKKVEREIRKKRERRRIIFWMIPVLLGGALLLTMNFNGWNSDQKLSATNSTGKPQEAVKPSARPASSKVDGSAPVENTGEYNSTVQAPSVQNHTSQTVTTEQIRVTKKHSIQYPKRTSTGKPGVVSKKDEGGENEDPNNSGTVITDDGNTADPTLVDRKINEVTTDKKTETVTPANSDVKVDKKVPDSTSTSPAMPANKRKWQVGLQASAGFSQSAESLFPGAKAAESNVIPFSTGYVQPGRYNEPGIGKHFSAGLSLTTTVSTAIKFTTGVNYIYASTVQKVGTKFRQDSLAQVVKADESHPYVWSNSSTDDYINSYHFIEIPVGVDVKAFPSMPIRVHTGVSISRLIASNALQYNQQHDVYFRNNEMLRKTGFNFFAGVSYGLFRDRLQIGPEFRYSLMPLTDSSGKDHLMTAGLKLRWSLN
jgi:hypothetical protein